MIGVIIVSLILALIIAAIAVFAVVKSYSMKNQPVDYPLDQFTKLDLQAKSDQFVDKHVTVRVISDSSDRRK